MASTIEAKKVFDAIAWRYDLANRVISLGLDVAWRNTLSKMCVQAGPERLLDVACGTGDQIVSLKRYLLPQTEVVGLDLLEKMVARGKKKVGGKNAAVSWFLGNGIFLPFKDKSFDAVTITFGLRNLPGVLDFLKEAKRVLRPKGRLWVMEFSSPSPSWFRQIYFFYLKKMLPVIGKLLTGSRASYDYLAQTVEKFPNQQALSQAFGAAGFEKVWHRNLCRGVVAIHCGENFSS
jgi:demethylmenaquinone methyltransferase/2-methoxy-6-polyprenyl-1,4-benzoquinol methylase